MYIHTYIHIYLCRINKICLHLYIPWLHAQHCGAAAPLLRPPIPRPAIYLYIYICIKDVYIYTYIHIYLCLINKICLHLYIP